jgi:hypothetical protein
MMSLRRRRSAGKRRNRRRHRHHRRRRNNHRWSEHGLGHLLNPTDPESEDRAWIGQAWLGFVRRSLGLPTRPLGFESQPAVGRVSVGSPHVLRAFNSLNAGKPYARQVKPFNFLLTCHIKPLGYPVGADPTRFHLIAPYEADARKWLKKPWIDQYSGAKFYVTTKGSHGTKHTARVKTYGEVLREYETHPEAKCAGAHGQVCGARTVGLLARRHVRIDGFAFIGKESNLLEEVEAGTVQDPQSVYVEYPDPRHDEWRTKVLPVLRGIPAPEIEAKTGLARSTIQAIRAGRRPHPKNRQRLVAGLVLASEESEHEPAYGREEHVLATHQRL